MLAKRGFWEKLFFLCMPVFVCAPAFADNSYAYQEKNGKLYFLLGVDGGLSLAKSSIGGEANKAGLGLNAKAGLSYYAGSLVLDGRFGWGLNSVAGTRGDGTQITVNNGSVFFDFSPRLRAGDNFQIGPVFEGRFGQDLSFKPTIAPLLLNEADQKFAMFLGAEALYETSNAKNPVRIGVRFITDLNIPNRQFFGVQGVLQVLFNLSGDSQPSGPVFKDFEDVPQTFQEPVNEDGMVDAEPATLEEPIDVDEPVSQMPDVEPTPANFVDITFLKVHFKTDSDRLQPASYQLAERVGEFLENNKSKFSMAEIEGHADDRGDARYNLDLSRRRAKRLEGILVAQGVPASQVKSRGFGKSQPLMQGKTDEARSQNRRVRLKIYDVSNPEQFKLEIERIRDLFSLGKRRPNGRWRR